MSQGRRSQEEKTWRKVLSVVLRLVPFLCFIAVFIFFYMIFDMNNKIEDKYYNTNDIVNSASNTNTIENNAIENNNVNQTTNTNTSANTNVESNTNTTVNNNNNNKPPISQPEEESDIVKAKNIFTDFWGEDNNSSINVYQNGDGEFIVRVTSNQTGANKYFRVNLANEEVSEY